MVTLSSGLRDIIHLKPCKLTEDFIFELEGFKVFYQIVKMFQTNWITQSHKNQSRIYRKRILLVFFLKFDYRFFLFLIIILYGLYQLDYFDILRPQNLIDVLIDNKNLLNK